MTLRCLLVTVTRNSRGHPIRSAKLVTGDPITIGRSPEASVYLPDPRVHRHHATIPANDGGNVHVVAQDADIDVSGELRGRVDLIHAERVLIGPYQISYEPPTGPDHDFGIAVELVQPFPADLAGVRGRSRISLGATWLSKRGPAWALFGLVAIFAIGLPLAYATSPRFRLEAIARLPDSVRRVAWDTVWDPGPLSLGHQPLSRKCDACHQVPFERVQDGACIECHKDTGEHARNASFHGEVFLGVRCADCHRDHRGERASAQTDPRLCVNCHGEIKTRYPGSTLVNISDFVSNHPPFSPSMLNAGENSGLKFPHDRHLAKAGIRSPSGLSVMECSQCHAPDSANVRFEPVKMAVHCAECHRLDFEPGASGRQVAHGNPDAVLTTLREFYPRVALVHLPGKDARADDLIQRPVTDATRLQEERGLAWSERRARAVATDLIESRVCAQCHQVARVGTKAARSLALGDGPHWTIEPVRIRTRWLPGAAFSHKDHRQSACEGCHDVRSSRRSADISMPTLATCRSCHTGAVAVEGKVRSPCETCHTFHQTVSR